MWEDDANKFGGRWVINMGRGSKAELDKLWLDVVSSYWSFVSIACHISCNCTTSFLPTDSYSYWLARPLKTPRKSAALLSTCAGRATKFVSITEKKKMCMCIKKAGYKYYILLKILHMFCLLRQPINIKWYTPRLALFFFFKHSLHIVVL